MCLFHVENRSPLGIFADLFCLETFQHSSRDRHEFGVYDELFSIFGRQERQKCLMHRLVFLEYRQRMFIPLCKSQQLTLLHPPDQHSLDKNRKMKSEREVQSDDPWWCVERECAHLLQRQTPTPHGCEY